MKHLLIIGGMKCGSTTIYDYLRKSNSLYFGTEKEPELLIRFNDPESLKKAHKSYFVNSEGKLTVDCSTRYSLGCSKSSLPALAINTYGKRLRVLYLVRDRWGRSRSHFEHLMISRGLNHSFEEAINIFPEIIEASLYGKQLAHWSNSIHINNIKVESLENLNSNPERVMRSIFDFLGCDFPDDFYVISPSNVTKNKPIPKGLLYNLSQHKFYRKYARQFIPLDVRRFFITNLLKKNNTIFDMEIGRDRKAEIDILFRDDDILFNKVLNGS